MNCKAVIAILGALALPQIVSGTYVDNSALSPAGDIAQDVLRSLGLERRDIHLNEGTVEFHTETNDDEELKSIADKYLKLGEDKWVGFLSRASPGHFQLILKKIKKLLGKGSDDCGEEVPAEEKPDCDGGDSGDSELPETPKDETDCESGNEGEDVEDDDSDCDGSTQEYVNTRTSRHRVFKKDIGSEVLDASVDESNPLAVFLLHLKDYAGKQDPANVLKAAGSFNFTEFDPSSSDEDRNSTDCAAEKVGAKDIKGSSMKKWLKSTAERRAEIIEQALLNDNFNESEAFKAEEFQFREGNIFLEDQDDIENGSFRAFSSPSLMYAIFAIGITLIASV
ncbi:DEKNAAC104606 [Brettanomyces naardenensis]|uniref:DEKNAAC104606 n=1 Tax=Brettanomyces naardenensis TaxID=13370 RepID=A0A448YR08_BRENA|nr:DEKNAAC104606 [Brettanomyces naardenensis]